MTQKKFSTADRIQSFNYAFQGLRTFFRTQHNAWIHVFIAVVVIAAGFYVGLDASEWLWIVLSIALVFITEMLNTSIEFLSDFVSPEIHPQIKKVKDVSAAAVLIASIGAVIIGLIIFFPRIILILT
jgi:diacylglycerol kinase